jgi:uncharacterized membrane protein YeiB
MITQAASRRFDGYDLARAMAVFGMLLVNFDAFADPVGANPPWLRTLIDWIEGRAAVTFVVLAGVGISLKTQSARFSFDLAHIRQHRRHLLKRGLVLFTGGLVLSLIWPADIMQYYGVYMALGLFLLYRSNRCLLLSAVLTVITSALLLTFFDPDQGWDLSASTIIDYWTPEGTLRRLFFNGHYPVFPWFAFLVLGMWIGRLDISRSKIRNLLAAAGAAALFGAEIATHFFTEWLMDHPAYLESEEFVRWAVIDPWTPLPLFIVAGAGTAVMAIAFCSRAGQPGKSSRLHRSFLAAGRMSLTVYISHILFGYVFLYLQMPVAGLSLAETSAAAVIYFMGSLTFCSFWSRRFGKGPMEKLMQMLVCTPGFLPFRRRSLHLNH